VLLKLRTTLGSMETVGRFTFAETLTTTKLQNLLAGLRQGRLLGGSGFGTFCGCFWKRRPD
jgi:hypothetical protein